MTGNDQHLRDQLKLMSDEALLRKVESGSEEFTAEAFELINAEVTNRGGRENLKLAVEETRARQKLLPRQDLALLKRFYPVVVLVAYGFFMYAINASLWFYWLCLFTLVASLFAVLFRPPFNPEDEIKELTDGMGPDQGSPPAVANAGDEGGPK